MQKKFIEKLRGIDRWQFFRKILIFLFFLLFFQLFRLTIIKGKEYRTLSDNRRVKDIQITAKRGEIHDKNGVVLAGNRPVFTAQLRKDEIKRLNLKERNKYFLKLMRYLEEDGVEYLDEFPILLDTFVYKRGVNSELSPTDYVIKKLIHSTVLDDLLTASFDKPYNNHYDYNFGVQALNALGMNEEGPIIYKSSTQKYEYISEEEKLAYKNDNDLDKNSSAQSDVKSMLIKQPTVLKTMLKKPIARQVVYNALNKNSEVPEIALRPFGNEYLDNYIEQKNALSKEYIDINLNTSAEHDFFVLFKENSLYNFLQLSYNDKPVINYFIESYNSVLNENYKLNDHLVYKENQKVDLEKLLKNKNIDRVLEHLFHNHELLTLAQQQLIKDGINSGISVAHGDIQYTQLKNAMDLYEKYNVKPSESTETLFKAIREYYEIDENLSKYESRDILNIYREINQQGSYAYIPLNFAYELKDRTVAQIEENIPIETGIEISIEPIRFYPFGDSSAHILGYIGNIAQEKEIKKYIDTKEYDRNALIGKTGIEEKYESYLHGKGGRRLVSVDSVGNTTEVMEEVQPKPGKNVRLSIDINLQRKAEEILRKGLAGIRNGGVYESPWGNYNYIGSKEKGRAYTNANSGAILVVDVKSGKILTMANYPSYNPNLFATGISSTDWESLKPKHEKDLLAPRPLYNISTQTAVQPGSIFKMVTAFSALEKGLDPNIEIQDGGYVNVNGQIFGCWLWNQNHTTHGAENLSSAIRDSCNYYFYSLALGKDQKSNKDIGVKIDANDISKTAKSFGLGESTGIEIEVPHESLGNRPDPKSKTKLLKTLLQKDLDKNMNNYYIGDKKLSKELKSEIIEQVLSLLDEKKKMTRPEVYAYLQELDLNPDAKLPGSSEGLVDKVKYTYIDQAQWNLSDTMNVTIGQGANSYTPVQMLRYIMAIANGGDLYELSLTEDISDPASGEIIGKNSVKSKQVGLSNENFYKPVRQGMKEAALTGANKKLFENFPIEVGIKTGTAERSGTNPYTKESYDPFAWEVGFAPFDDPEIAVCIMAFQGGSGSNASPMMQSIFAEYFGLNKEYKESILPIETTLEP